MSTRTFLLATCVFITMLAARGQNHWYQIAQPTTYNLNKASFIDSLRGWVAGDHGTILRTTNGGMNWIALNTGVTDNIRDIFMLNDRLGWAVSWIDFIDTSTYFGSEILKTTNGGNTWLSTRFPEFSQYFYSITFFDSLDGWIGGARGDIERTNDGGATWNRAVTDSSVASGFTIRNIRFFSRQYGFALGGNFDITGTILRTTNGGQLWTGASVSPEPVFEVHFIDSMHIIGLTGDYEYGPSMVATSDGGNQWEYIYLGLWDIPRAMAFRTPGEGWVPLANQIMVTRDTARTWQIPDTLGARQISHLLFTDSLTGYAVADSGVIYKYRDRVVGVTENDIVVPSLQLWQNYPNPFNPTTTIKYELPAFTHVVLKIYEITGREVMTLVNEEMEAGTYEAVFDAARLASGTYLYKLQAGSFVETKKMVLIR